MQAVGMQDRVNANTAKAGFTLIEIIAVLVILAVLAAVAIPRFLTLVDDARDAALQGALAAGLSHVSLAYGRLALQDGAEPAVGAVATEAGTTNPMQSEDFTFTFVAGTDDITITATETRDNPRSAEAIWQMP
jgi:prepilin-type N-terminal cleavage/methylation domain-containing protein